MAASHAAVSLLRHTPDYFLSRDQLCKNYKDFLCLYDRTVHLWTAIQVASCTSREGSALMTEACKRIRRRGAKCFQRLMVMFRRNAMSPVPGLFVTLLHYLTDNISGLNVYGAVHYISQTIKAIISDFRLQPRSRCELRSSGLCSE